MWDTAEEGMWNPKNCFGTIPGKRCFKVLPKKSWGSFKILTVIGHKSGTSWRIIPVSKWLITMVSKSPM